MIDPQAIKTDLNTVNRKLKHKVIDKINQLEEEPLKRDDVGPVRKHGHTKFRQKIEIQEEGFRALFDIVNGKVKVYAIMQRPPEEYDEQLFRKIEQRSENV